LTTKQISRLQRLELIDHKLKIADIQLAYAAFEHYCQNICPDKLDQMILQAAEKGQIILDLCCGPGSTVRALSVKRPNLVYAVDGFPYHIEIVKQMVDLLGLDNIEPILTDAHCLPIEDHSVDLLVSRVSLNYLHINKALDEISRVLKADGKAVFVVHGLGYVWFSAIKQELFKACKMFLRGLQFSITKKQSHPSEIFLTPGILMKQLEKRGFSDFTVSYEAAINDGLLPLYFGLSCRKS
jgi:ubiquinone/menaquinone biosynthesis C-methylase UbiE